MNASLKKEQKRHQRFPSKREAPSRSGEKVSKKRHPRSAEEEKYEKETFLLLAERGRINGRGKSPRKKEKKTTTLYTPSKTNYDENI